MPSIMKGENLWFTLVNVRVKAFMFASSVARVLN
nr:MAG TPA: hypothetical protein [Caudoviricetes sp.]